MGRLIVLIVAVVLVAYLARRAFGARAPRDAAPPTAPGELVRCAHCGLHLPAGEARSAGGAWFCSDEHARIGPGRD